MTLTSHCWHVSPSLQRKVTRRSRTFSFKKRRLSFKSASIALPLRLPFTHMTSSSWMTETPAVFVQQMAQQAPAKLGSIASRWPYFFNIFTNQFIQTTKYPYYFDARIIKIHAIINYKLSWGQTLLFERLNNQEISFNVLFFLPRILKSSNDLRCAAATLPRLVSICGGEFPLQLNSIASNKGKRYYPITLKRFFLSQSTAKLLRDIRNPVFVLNSVSSGKFLGKNLLMKNLGVEQSIVNVQFHPR